MKFLYTEEDLEDLKSRDRIMEKVIDYYGPVDIDLNEDLYAEIVYHILGQQISVQVQDALHDRLKASCGTITPQAVLRLGPDKLRELGMSRRKAETIVRIAQMITDGELDFSLLKDMSDDEAIRYLTKIKGVGPWTAEMILMFGLGRTDVFTRGDIALNRGLKIMYGLEEVNDEVFDYYHNLFKPYGTLACLYIWAVGENKKEGIVDFVKEQRKLLKLEERTP